MKTIETPRLILRGLRETDADDMFAYATDPDVGPRAGWAPHESREDSLAYLRMAIEQDEVWAVVDRDSQRMVGTIGLHRDMRRSYSLARSLGYVLSQRYWGRGLMVEAARAAMRYGFEEMGLLIISAVHYPFNLQSRRVMEKCGMRYDATLRMASCLPSGELVDDVCHSITREEWQAQQAE